MNKNICMMLHEYYPNDIRVNKEASALISAGFTIDLICLRRKKEAAYEVINGIHVHRIAMAQSFFWRGIWDVLLVILNFNQPKFGKKLKQLYQQKKFNSIHVHDLPLARTALNFKKKHPNVKVLLDFHENYPEAMKVWFQWKSNPIIRLKNKLFFNFPLWLSYEKAASREADHVIVVVDEMQQRIQKLHDLSPDKMAVITNSEEVSFLNQETYPDVYEKEEGDFILAYTGNVGPHRGVDTVVKALAHLKGLPKIRLEITGKLSTDSERSLRELIRKNGVEDQVKINGYQPFHKFYSYMALADINLIPHNRNGHTDHTIPHKLYQGMLVGKPVLVSDAPPLKRVVDELQSGLVFVASDDQDCASQIRELYSNKTLFNQLGENGHRNTVQNGYNWASEGTKLVDLYNSTLKENDVE